MSEIAIVIIGGLLVYGLLMASGIHVIHEGYVGIYKSYGVLQDRLTDPGMHFRIPFMQTYEEVQISVQTDVVKNIPCGTSGGTLVYFDRIEVVNKLRRPFVFDTIKNYTSSYDKFWIYNKIHHEINQFCSKHTLQQIYIDEFENLDEELIKSLQFDLTKWAPGIEIISIRITKPRIPERIRANFEEMEQTKVQYMISSERQKVIRVRCRLPRSKN
jgi:regulator of protease activity HflC (stomatin/prohibitin superfamily)